MTNSLYGTPPPLTFLDNAEDTYSMATRIVFAVDGNITHIRFWGTTNALVTVPRATVYSTAGVNQIPGAVAFGALVTGAWNTTALPVPFHVTAGETWDIVVGPRNRYAGSAAVMPINAPPLQATQGRFIVSAVSPPVFPTTNTTAWYGIDILFEPDLDATLAGTLPSVVSLFEAEATELAQINGTLPAITSDIVALAVEPAVLGGTLPSLQAHFDAVSAAGGQTVGPCGWTIPDPLCCAEEWAAVPLAVQSAARDYAATILWAATGRQFGLCQVSVRPCGMKRCSDGGGEFWGYDWSGGTWVPYIFNGQWFNCACPGTCCCDPRCQVRLMGPVNSIVEVLVDGIAVDPDTYFVNDEHWLVRTHPDCWPRCADQNVLAGDGLFEVTYLRGTPVPNALLRAAAVLACEWAKACIGSDSCRLSNRVTSIVRQGITIDMVAPEDLLESGRTGLWEVDTVIAAYNPHRTQERLRIYAPELNVPKMTTWP